MKRQKFCEKNGRKFICWEDVPNAESATVSETKLFGGNELAPPKRGCTDPFAFNFDKTARVDDGSCYGIVVPKGGCMNEDAINWDEDATYDDGSCVFENNDVVFNTAAQKVIETKIGANIFELKDIDKLASWTARANAIGFQSYYYTPATTGMSEAHATIVNNFLTACNADVGVYYPIRDAATAAAFPTFLDWLIARFNPTFIQLDQESLLSSVGLSNATYISRSQQVFGYTNIPCCWDCGLVYKNNPDTIARNAALSPRPAPPTRGRQYEQIQDICAFNTDQDYNLVLLNNYFNTLLPGFNADFFTTFPSLTKQIILQWQNEDAAFVKFLSEPLRNLAFGEVTKYTLSNTEIFEYLFFMRLSELVRGTHPEEQMLTILTPCFKFDNAFPVSIPLDGCDAQGFNTGNNFGILINNQKSGTHTIQPASIIIPIKTVSGNFTRNSVWATGLTQTLQYDNLISEAAITVRPYSTNVITFTAI